MLHWNLFFHRPKKLSKCAKLTILGYEYNFFEKIIYFKFIFNNLKERLILFRITTFGWGKNTLKQQSYIEF